MANPELSPYHPEVKSSQEACGITGNFSKNGENITPTLPFHQNKLQHRGYDSAGIAVSCNGEINVHTGIGKVAQVFPPSFNFLEKGLVGEMGIGHNRYGTSGEGDKDDLKGAQPYVAQWNKRKVAIAFNGNIPDSLREILRDRIDGRLPNGKFDTVDIANAIVTADGNTWLDRIRNALDGIPLAFSLTILTDREEVFGLRCPAGTWPLWMGESDDKIIFASENRVDKSPEMVWKEVKPGELVQATRTGIIRKQLFVPTETQSRCSLHDVYGAKGDSSIKEGKSYSEFRKLLGKELAREKPFVGEDFIYVGVPQSGLPVAEGYAEEVGLGPSNLILANGDRSFINKNDREIQEVIEGKYRIDDPEAIRGKKMVVLDDSGIRGNTARKITKLLRMAGASEVHLLFALPKFTQECDQGYFIKKSQLVALRREGDILVELHEEQIASELGADSVYFLSIGGVKRTYVKILGKKEVACMACMGQEHPLKKILKAKASAMKERDVVFSA